MATEDCGIPGCSGPVKGKGWPSMRPPKISAQYDSVCPECHEEIYEGDTIFWSEWLDMYVCQPCHGAGA